MEKVCAFASEARHLYNDVRFESHLNESADLWLDRIVVSCVVDFRFESVIIPRRLFAQK